ncbi:MAG: energy transducer TonB [Steroidobacteraceae bacterium]|nr:energy transducer TonB [Deltaproteobacteria bacterium]
MSDSYIEKSFLFMLVASLLLHLCVFAALYYWPQEPPEPPKEPVFIDLQQMPEIKQPSLPRQQKTRRQAEKLVQVEREMAPRGAAQKDSQPPQIQTKPQAKPQQEQSEAAAVKPSLPLPTDSKRTRVAPGSSTASLLKPKSQTPQQQPQLFPGANRLSKREESYRQKFENDIAEGDTRFLNSDDIQFGSFLRRFEGAVYGVWRYPQEAAQNGIEGITPVRITFNRSGEIVNVQQLESSGARILDEEVLRTLRAIGPVGGFPKGYDKEEFHLIAFFQYGGARKALR